MYNYGSPSEYLDKKTKEDKIRKITKELAEEARINAIRGVTPNISEYSVESFTYPENLLGSEEYGGNYAMFFINVQTESKLKITGGGYGKVDADIVYNATTGLNNVGGAYSKGGLIGYTGLNLAKDLIVAGGAAAAAGASAYSTKGSKLAAIAAGAAILGPSLLKEAAMGVIAYAGEFSKPTKRLKTAIALHMPIALSVRYSMLYEESETPIGLKTTNALGADTNGTLKSAAVAGGLKQLGDVGNILSKITKMAVNPTKEQIFKDVDFRTFTFTYLFAPKSATEAGKILALIQQFKFHMHPEFKDADKFLYIYPSEFDIVYYSGGRENDKIHRHTSCVLIDLTLDYAPQGTYSTFANGMPTQISMNMVFKELAKLDKEKISIGKF
jgi:hypothetical protein